MTWFCPIAQDGIPTVPCLLALSFALVKRAHLARSEGDLWPMGHTLTTAVDMAPPWSSLQMTPQPQPMPFFFLIFYLFTWLRRVFYVVRGIFSCGRWDLVP